MNFLRHFAWKPIVIVIIALIYIPCWANKTIDIFSFNDFHGQVAENDAAHVPGMVKFVGETKRILEKHPQHILVSAGDNYQGSALSNLTHGKPVNNMMKELHVIASAVGNHEFDWGVRYISRWRKQGHLKYLATNIINKKTHQPVTWANPYLIVKKDGLKIGFIGLATQETASMAAPKFVKYFQFANDAASAQKDIQLLKSKKVNAIIALTHIPSAQNPTTHKITGDELRALIQHTKGLNAVISGHSHQFVAGQMDHVPIIQAGKYGEALGDLRLTFNDQGKLKNIKSHLYYYSHLNHLPLDHEAKQTLYRYQQRFSQLMNQVVGYAPQKISHSSKIRNVTPLGEWACHALRKQTGVQVAILNGGGLRQSLQKGKITIGELYTIMPFDNHLMTLKLSGKNLKKVIEHGIDNPKIRGGQFSGLRVVYDPKAAPGHHIVMMKLSNGKPIKNHHYYMIATNDFMVQGGDHYHFSNAKDVKDTHILLRDALIKSIRSKYIVSPNNKPVLSEKHHWG